MERKILIPGGERSLDKGSDPSNPYIHDERFSTPQDALQAIEFHDGTVLVGAQGKFIPYSLVEMGTFEYGKGTWGTRIQRFGGFQSSPFSQAGVETFSTSSFIGSHNFPGKILSRRFFSRGKFGTEAILCLA